MKSKLVILSFNKNDKECVVSFADMRIQPSFIKHQHRIEECINVIKSVIPEGINNHEISVTIQLDIVKDLPYIEGKVKKKGKFSRFVKKKIDELSGQFIPIFREIIMETIRNENQL